LVGTLVVLLCEWQRDKKYLAERIRKPVPDLKLLTLLLVLQESSRQRELDMESQSHIEELKDQKSC
jgi:hypothetical protein